MKNQKILFVVLVLASVAFISGTLYHAGSPGKKTGSPLDGSTCTQCHSGTAIEAEMISTDIPETGYLPGETYTVTLSSNYAEAARFGFEITAENEAEKTGTFIITDEATTKLTNGDQAVTHKSGGTTPEEGSISWSFEWTAPETNSGDISFYAVVNAANGNGSTSGDQIITSILSVPSATTGILNTALNNGLKVYPNPASGYVNIESQHDITKVALIDLNGKVIHQEEFSARDQALFNFPTTANGLHFVQVFSEGSINSYPIQIKP
ncbi:MAG: T9SS type A sorting domain-containing protein [Prolixibacteraceae bacterium]|nr:T9SS type A sorting domain-containing protein [Prolixibacteraceae bacterium]